MNQTFGGTNWGSLGYMDGYISYGYDAAITEERGVWRKRFSEQKLEARFPKASPAYLTATPGLRVNGSHGASASIAVILLLGGNQTWTNFYVVRQADLSCVDTTHYTTTVSTSVGYVTIPKLRGQLSLNGRDFKFHATNYDPDGINLIYSSAKIFI